MQWDQGVEHSSNHDAFASKISRIGWHLILHMHWYHIWHTFSSHVSLIDLLYPFNLHGSRSNLQRCQFHIMTHLDLQGLNAWMHAWSLYSLWLQKTRSCFNQLRLPSVPVPCLGKASRRRLPVMSAPYTELGRMPIQSEGFLWNVTVSLKPLQQLWMGMKSQTSSLPSRMRFTTSSSWSLYLSVCLSTLTIPFHIWSRLHMSTPAYYRHIF